MINELDKIIPNSTEILSVPCDLITKESEIADELKIFKKKILKKSLILVVILFLII